MATEAQTCALICTLSILANQYNSLYNKLLTTQYTIPNISTSVEKPLQIHHLLFKTKPTYWILKMNASSVKTRDYKNDNDFRPGKTNPNKAKTNPISEMLKMNVGSVRTRDYENEPLRGRWENKPNQSQFKPSEDD